MKLEKEISSFTLSQNPSLHHRFLKGLPSVSTGGKPRFLLFSTFLFWNLIFHSISSQFIWVLLVSPSCESWFVLFWCVLMFSMTEVIDRHDFHGFDSGLKVIMGSHLWSIVQNIQVKTNQMETNVYIQIIFKSLSCLSKKKRFNSDILQRLSNFDCVCRCRMAFD